MIKNRKATRFSCFFVQILIYRTVANSLLQRRRGTTKWWMRRSPLGCISRELCEFYLVTQGFLCNETRLTKDVKPLKERPPHPPLPRSPFPAREGLMVCALILFVQRISLKYIILRSKKEYFYWNNSCKLNLESVIILIKIFLISLKWLSWNKIGWISRKFEATPQSLPQRGRGTAVGRWMRRSPFVVHERQACCF